MQPIISHRSCRAGLAGVRFNRPHRAHRSAGDRAEGIPSAAGECDPLRRLPREREQQSSVDVWRRAGVSECIHGTCHGLGPRFEDPSCSLPARPPRSFRPAPIVPTGRTSLKWCAASTVLSWSLGCGEQPGIADAPGSAGSGRIRGTPTAARSASGGRPCARSGLIATS